MRTVIFDSIARKYLTEFLEGTIISLGSGLDFRFDRIDNGTVTWYDVDMPEVISLRNRLFNKSARERQISCSVLESAWMDLISEKSNILILAEGLFVYFAPHDVKNVFIALSTRFHHSRIALDVLGNHRLNQLKKGMMIGNGLDKICSLFKWGMDGWHIMETWHPGIRFLDEWHQVEMLGDRLPDGMKDIIDAFPWIKDQDKIGLLSIGSADKTNRFNNERLSGAMIVKNHRMAKEHEILDDIVRNKDWWFI